MAAVLYTSMGVSLALGWHGWQNIVMCGTVVSFLGFSVANVDTNLSKVYRETESSVVTDNASEHLGHDI